MFKIFSDFLPSPSELRQDRLVRGGPGTEILKHAFEFRRPFDGFLDLPNFPRLPFSEILDHPAEAGHHVPQLDLFRNDVNEQDLLFLQCLPAGQIHTTGFLEGLRFLGNLSAERVDPLPAVDGGRPEGADLVVGLPLTPFQDLGFRKVLLPPRGEVGDLPPGEFDSLFLDIDRVFRSVALFLSG